ncbi:MAG: hypothetical protein IT569_05465 [Leptospiraceae bacterium]|nr:hypothetical protein [Leptospiraceae bacterium]
MAERKELLIAPRLKKERNLLDLYESYKYMNAVYSSDLLSYEDGRWDYSKGWLELNVNLREMGVFSDSGRRIFPRIPVSSA